MKGNKKILVLAILLLLVVASFGTYAIYQSSASGSGTASAAAWVVQVNNSNIVTSSTHTFDLGSINWSSSDHVATGKIAPGSTGTVNLVIDATGSEVSLDYSVALGDVTVNDAAVPSGTISVSTSSSLTGSILLSASSKTVTIPLTITWLGAANDTETKNSNDVGLAGSTITLGVTVTATQHLGS